jgi:TPR repeat protein
MRFCIHPHLLAVLLFMSYGSSVAQNDAAPGTALPGSALPGNASPSAAPGISLSGIAPPVTAILGSVSSVAGTEIQLTLTGKLLPNAGDKVDFLFKFHEFNEEVVVGSGKVLKVADTTATVKFEPGSGNKPKIGQRARIHSSARREAGAPPATPAPGISPSTPSPSLPAPPVTPPTQPAMPAAPGAPPSLPAPPTIPAAPDAPPAPVGNIQRNFQQNFQRSFEQRPPVPTSSLGLYTDNLPVEMIRALQLPPRSGAQIIGVTPGSPAALAGLQKDDIITEVNGEIVREGVIERLPYTRQPGTRLTFAISRNLKAYVKQVTLGTPLSDVEMTGKMRVNAEAGDAAAQMGYGGRLIRGVGCPVNAAEGMAWITRAAEQDLRKAQGVLACIHFTKLGDAAALALALEWFQRAAAQGDAMSQTLLAGFYYEKQDFQQAALYARQSAEQGQEEGQFIYGLMLLKGQGVKANHAEGMKRLESAANASHVEAMTALGAFYEEGRGVKKSTSKAREWYQKAAARGDTEAAERLKRLNR